MPIYILSKRLAANLFKHNLAQKGKLIKMEHIRCDEQYFSNL